MKLGIGLSVTALVVAAACTGSDPDAVPETPDAAVPTAEGGAPLPAATASDAGLACEAGETACDGVCANLGSSGDHCGACGHSCGGGACVTSTCQPMLVRDKLVDPVFDIDPVGKTVLFGLGDSILSCPLGGCGDAQPTQIGAITVSVHGASNSGVMLVASGNVFFMADVISGTSGPSLDWCPITQRCTVPPPFLQESSHQPFSGAFATDGKDVYWGWLRSIVHATCTGPGDCPSQESIFSLPTGLIGPFLAVDDASAYFFQPSSPSDLVRCPKSGPCGTPSPIATINGPIVKLLAHGGRVYVLTGDTQDGMPGGKIQTCPSAGASTCSPTPFVQNQPAPTQLVVDDTDVTWLNTEGTTPNAIVTCPVSGCVGGPRLLAKDVAGAYALHSDGAFIYWATGTSIWRIAK